MTLFFLLSLGQLLTLQGQDSAEADNVLQTNLFHLYGQTSHHPLMNNVNLLKLISNIFVA